MNPLDITFCIVIAFCLIRGAFRGIVKEASAIIGVFGGFFAAYTYYPLLGEQLSRFIDSTAWLNIISFLIIFGAVFAAVSALGVLIKYLLKVVFLGWVDRLCGAGFGLVKGILISAVLLMVFATFLDKGAPLIRQSKTAPYVTIVSEALSSFASKDLRQEFTTKIEDARKIWEKRF
ncbi:CvpA family protein [Desulfoluna spongiiphila]|uniref:Membrane protein required for colicin V production n=1 Tax=Desulfoluna spongiiphila TaxID=419481 RepID=A0A1G5IBE2_9BACT|nr:CvpA family protein [Desulfoluna spongiiphila]SCY72980.1 membrane protein required for colicin V production [Desulfoluna spongiiphila]VVS93147.1 colicin v production cvpa [Desulfoluna spongiiphila]